jgi:hypothetical protein
MAFLYLLLTDISCIASGTYLVSTEHYLWAWIPFLMAACTTVKTTKS